MNVEKELRGEGEAAPPHDVGKSDDSIRVIIH